MKTGRQAAKAFKEKKTNRVNMCLWECQEIYPTNHWYPSAWSQWQNAKDKSEVLKRIPLGAPIYFRGGRSGHVALYVGNGEVRSTDAGGRGIMATVPISWFIDAWGYEPVGWSKDLGGKMIDFITTIEVSVKSLKPGVDDSESVKQLRYRLIRRGFLKVSSPLSLDRPGNKYTPSVSNAVKKWQKKKNHKETGVLTNKQAKEFFAPNPRVKVIPE
ncbi:MAG TPA: peptidoglycan-binding protein [Saccharofermentans sp.]|nr:peptidoglycan-binding protein [Saccharofermentans sp.]